MLGSTHFTRTPPAGLKIADVRAMLNLDMVGRLRDNRATRPRARRRPTEWPALLAAACADARVGCAPSRDGGFGPSDQMPFYAAGVPVLHFFTGVARRLPQAVATTPDRINAAGAAQVARPSAALAREVARARPNALTFQRMTGPPRRGRRAQLQRVAGHDPRLRRPARRRAGRAARGRARRRRGREGRACGAATS